MGRPTEVPLVMDAPPERSPLVTTPKSVDAGYRLPHRPASRAPTQRGSSGEMNTCIRSSTTCACIDWNAV
jgi:hypothetical protein